MAGKLGIAVIVCVAVCGLLRVDGVNGEDSPEMTEFKKSLSVDDQALLTKMKSKTRYIQAVLNSKTVVDERDKLNIETRSEDLECCNCNPGTPGCFHPDDKKRSRIIRCCAPAPPAKRDQVDNKEVEKVLSQMSPADKELLMKHKSKLQYLVAAAKAAPTSTETKVQKKQEVAPEAAAPAAEPASRPAVSADVIKQLREGLSDLQHKLDELAPSEQQAETAQVVSDKELNEVSDKFVEDVNLAKEKGINLHDLLAAFKKRAAQSGN